MVHLHKKINTLQQYFNYNIITLIIFEIIWEWAENIIHSLKFIKHVYVIYIYAELK